MKNKLKGLGLALITPFTENNDVDIDSLKNLVNYTIEGGADYIVMLGTTSEYPTLNDNEKKLIVKIIKEENRNRVPLVICIGGNDTFKVIEEIKKWDLEDITAILSPSPYYNKPSQEGIYQHYKAIAESTKKEIILYNVPGRTSSNILPSTTIRLAEDFKNIVAIKEASGDIKQYLKIINESPKDFYLISGDDDLMLSGIYNGGLGVISVVGQVFIKEFSNILELAFSGNFSRANDINKKLLNIIDLAFREGNPSGIKEMAKQMGIIKSNKVRLPLVEATKELSKEISKNLKDLNIIFV